MHCHILTYLSRHHYLTDPVFVIEMPGEMTLYVYRSLNDHGKLVIKSNQKPLGEARYLALISLMSSQYVSEMSRVPVQNWSTISI